MDQYDALRTEQQQLREDVETLKKRVAGLAERLGEHERLDEPPREQAWLSRQARLLLRELPTHFTVEDLITASEQAGIDVLRAYQDLQVLLLTGHVVQTYDTAFEKTGKAVP